MRRLGAGRAGRQAWGRGETRRSAALTDDPRPVVRRLPAVGAIVLVVAAGLTIDRIASDADDGPSRPPGVQMPKAAPATARSSAWFCAGATAEPGSVADGSVVVVNAGQRPLTASVTVFPTVGETRLASLQVAPAGRASLRLSDLVVSPYASALVELDGGQAGVELEVTGPAGNSVTPCASSASASWYFAEGVTTRDASEQLLIFNPFPDDAVVDFSFTTEEDRAQPQGLTGVAVAGRSMSAVNVGDFVQRRESVTARVIARRGRIVVNRLQAFDGTGAHKGVALTLGAASTGSLWYFATGLVTDGVSERFQIYNPARVEAVVTLDIVLDEGTAEPLTLTVPPESRLSVVAADESRIPKGALHAVTVRTDEATPVVVERSTDTGPPVPITGFASSPGARLASTQWLIVAGGANETLDQVLAFFNPGPSASRVSVDSLLDGVRKPIAGLAALDIPAGARRSVRLGDHVKGPAVPLVVTATKSVVVERTLSRVNGVGNTSLPAIPLR